MEWGWSLHSVMGTFLRNSEHARGEFSSGMAVGRGEKQFMIQWA